MLDIINFKLSCTLNFKVTVQGSGSLELELIYDAPSWFHIATDSHSPALLSLHEMLAALLLLAK